MASVSGGRGPVYSSTVRRGQTAVLVKSWFNVVGVTTPLILGRDSAPWGGLGGQEMRISVRVLILWGTKRSGSSLSVQVMFVCGGDVCVGDVCVFVSLSLSM